MFAKPRVRRGRKLLVASVGVATLSFVGANCSSTSVANLPAPPSCEEQPNNPYCYPKPDAAADGADAAGPDGGADAASDDASSG